MEHVQFVLRANILKMTSVILVQMVVFMIKNLANVYVMKLVISTGIEKPVSNANIRCIGILGICNVRTVPYSKYTI